MSDSTIKTKKANLERKILGVKIRHARTRAGLNPKEVGDLLGLPAQNVVDFEFGRLDVTLPQLEVMAVTFNVPVIYFWSQNGISEPNTDFPAKQAMLLRQRIIGALLRQARANAGLSQEELGQALGLPTSRITSYEFGQAAIPLSELATMAQHLNVSLDYFLDEGIQPNNPNGQVTSLDDIADYSQLPKEVKVFLSNPANLLYVNIAMKLSELSAETLRALAEGLLEVTY